MIMLLSYSCSVNFSNNDVKSNSASTETTCSDIDGNIYKTIIIGEQEWMAENLRVKHYRNGDPIQKVEGNDEWCFMLEGAYCNYDNTIDSSTTYGILYNWYAVNDSRNISPKGWHVATDAEWQQLVDFLGGDSIAGNLLKARKSDSLGVPIWGDDGATNESGFSALPLGNRPGCSFLGGAVIGRSFDAYFWTATARNNSPTFAWGRWLIFNNNTSVVSRAYHQKNYGFSIRCIKDKI